MKEKVKCLMNHAKNTNHLAYVIEGKWFVKCNGKAVRVKMEIHDPSYSLITATKY